MRALALLVLPVVSVLTSGCTPGGYFTDRWRDAKDVFTVSVGIGGGAKARVGCVQAGLFYNADAAGLRGGAAFCETEHYQDIDMVTTLPLVPYYRRLLCSYEEFGDPDWRREDNHDPAIVLRRKDFGALGPLPLLTLSDRIPYYTQIEVAAGVGGTLRLGFNPGELLDFLLGWFGIDIYDDDLESSLRSKNAFDDRFSTGSLEERGELAVSILKRVDQNDPRNKFALDWLLKQPASEGVIDALLLRTKYQGIEDYFVAMDKKFLPILYERIEKTDDGDVAHGLARAFAKRRDSGSAPVLFGILGKEYKKGDKSAPATAAMTLGSFGAQVLPEAVRSWKEHRDFPTRKRLVIVCEVVGSAASRTLLEQWREENKADLIEMKNSGKTESEDYKSKLELAVELRIALRNFKEKEVAP